MSLIDWLDEDCEVVNLQEYEESSPHEVAEVICLHCMNRWIKSVHWQGEWLANWECPKCGKVGGIIYTGQPLGY